MKTRQSGVALLAAVLVVALAATLVAALLNTGEATRARTRNALRSEQAWQLGRGLEFWAAAVLMRDAEASPGIDARGEAWLQPLPPIPVPGGEITGMLRDATGCLNLNRLHREGVDVQYEIDRFTRLLGLLGLNPAIAAQAVDWIDADVIPGPGGAEDLTYQQRSPPYRAANRDFVDVSELRLLPSMDPRAYAKLRPLVCALPPAALTNLNFASPLLWRALDARITEALAKQLARDGEARFAGPGEITEELHRLGVDGVPMSGLGTQSDYVLLQAQLQLDGLRFVEHSLLERRLLQVQVLARARGSVE